MKTMCDLDYIALYAKSLKKDSRLFRQQKQLIDDQIKASQSLFKNSFRGDFKLNARKYLRGIKLIS